MNVKENLIAARAKIADIKDWITGTYVANICGVTVEVDSKEACRYCGVGALMVVIPIAEGDLFSRSLGALSKSSEFLFSDQSVSRVNDKLGHEAILKIYDHAINSIPDL